MADSKWTDEQLAAINTGGCNLLVSAAAGSGKTAVLVERLIKKVTDINQPADIDNLLVVTFTKAAAAEMRDRINQAIEKELNLNPSSRHLLRQSALINKAPITNLHSLCLDLIRQYFYRLNLDPSFRVANESEVQLLRLEVLEDLFEDLYLSEDPQFVALVDSFGGNRDDSMLWDIILKLYDFSVSNPWPKDWIINTAAGYRLPIDTALEKTPWGQSIMQWLSIQFNGYISSLTKALELANLPGGPQNYSVNLQADLVFFNELINCRTWDNLYQSINDFTFSKLKSCSKDVEENLKANVQSIRQDIKDKLKKIREEFFNRPSKDYLLDLSLVTPLVETLVKVVLIFSEKYSQCKLAKNIVDFSDLEHFCLKILMDSESTPDNVIPSAVALELRNKFTEVMVDEYQDINSVQEIILRLLSRQDSVQPNLFMVGDVKQSIYKFRLAEPELFMYKYQTFPRTAGHINQAIDLAKNFRSRREVIDAVNFLFSNIMTNGVGEIGYDKKAELVYGAEMPEHEDLNLLTGPVEIHLLEKKKDTQESPASDEDEEINSIQREARLTAQKINELITGNAEIPPAMVFDKKLGDYRKVSFRDIVILMRATRSTSNTFLEEFRQAGIPAYADLGTGYFAATEIETMLSILKVIDNPRQDIPLAAVLRSPIVNLNARELAQIRLLTPNGEFYQAVIKASKSTEDDYPEIHHKLNSFLEQLDQWRAMARRGPLSELIWHIYTKTGFLAYAGGMPGGAQRQANLRALYDRARQYELTNFRGLFSFLKFVEKFQEGGSDLGTARALGENEDVVRIMSIHKSKGLEFPVVFVVSLGKQFNTNDLKNTVLFHKSLGLGLPVVDTNLRITYPTIIQQGIKKKLYLEMLAEEMRILYVAMTRAREKLILIGSVNDLKVKINKWIAGNSGDCLSEDILINARTYLDWILPSLARHRDGSVLHQFAAIDNNSGHFIDDNSHWQIYIWPAVDNFGDLNIARNDENQIWLEKVRNSEYIPNAGQYKELVTQLLSWQYPYQSLVGKGAKVSVTEVKNIFSEEITEPILHPDYPANITTRPKFVQQKSGLTPAEQGSAVHLVMQHIDFNTTGETDLEKQLQKLLDKELLTEEQLAAIDINKIRIFLESPLGRRLAKSTSILREQPFTMALPASVIYPEVAEEIKEMVIVQGIIDCLFEDEQGLVLLDYKTDHISGTDYTKIINRYQGQLNLYAKAVENILKTPVQEKYLYLFGIDKALKVS